METTDQIMNNKQEYSTGKFSVLNYIFLFSELKSYENIFSEIIIMLKVISFYTYMRLQEFR